MRVLTGHSWKLCRYARGIRENRRRTREQGLKREPYTEHEEFGEDPDDEGSGRRSKVMLLLLLLGSWRFRGKERIVDTYHLTYGKSHKWIPVSLPLNSPNNLHCLPVS